MKERVTAPVEPPVGTKWHFSADVWSRPREIGRLILIPAEARVDDHGMFWVVSGKSMRPTAALSSGWIRSSRALRRVSRRVVREYVRKGVDEIERDQSLTRITALLMEGRRDG